MKTEISPGISLRFDLLLRRVEDIYPTVDRVSVPLPIAIDILLDTMARDRVPMYLFSV